MQTHSWRRTVAKAMTYRVMSFVVATYAIDTYLGIPVITTILFNAVLMGINFGIFVANEVGWRKTSFGKPKSTRDILCGACGQKFPDPHDCPGEKK